MKKQSLIFLIIFLLPIIMLFNCSKKETPKEVIIGGFFDLTGPTSVVCKDYADGVIDYIKYVNENGGINGRKIKFLYKDYQYKISQAYSWYETLKRKKVIAIIGWGTGDTEALAPKITVDKIPYISASYSEELANGRKYPYNFIGGVSYSDQAKIALKFIKKQSGTGNPKIAYIYNDTSFGRSAFSHDVDDFAENIGANVVEKVVIPLSGENAEMKIEKMKSDWAIVQETSGASIAIIKAIKKLNKDINLVLLNWAIDETIAKAIPDVGKNRIYGTIPYGVWSDTNLSAIKLLHKLNEKYHPEIPERTCRYVQGYINARILIKAIEMSGDDLIGETIKKNLENLENFDTGASFSKVTYTEKLHKPSASVMIYSVDNGKLLPYSKLLISIEQRIWTEY